MKAIEPIDPKTCLYHDLSLRVELIDAAGMKVHAATWKAPPNANAAAPARLIVSIVHDDCGCSRRLESFTLPCYSDGLL